MAPSSSGRSAVAHEAAERVADQEDGRVARVEAHLLDGGGQVLGDVVVDVAHGARAEVTRATVTAEIEVEDVVARAREVVRDAARRQVPRVAVLSEAVDEQHRRPRPAARCSARRLRTIASGILPPVTTSSLTKVARSWRSIVCSRVRP